MDEEMHKQTNSNEKGFLNRIHELRKENHKRLMHKYLNPFILEEKYLWLVQKFGKEKANDIVEALNMRIIKHK